ncbi:MAG: ABC transporter ATP-binding protein [Bacteroidota bacterium]
MNSERTQSIIRTSGLAIGYAGRKKTFQVASNIDLAIPEGALVSLVGANGVGKSTLLRTLAGMQPPLEGGVAIREKSLIEYHPLELATLMGVVLTEAPSSKNLSVLEFVSLGRQPHTNWMGSMGASDRECVTWAMEQTSVSALKNKKCFELSDGQLQRVAIARALAQETPVILLDEPTTHLDLYHRAAILKLLRTLVEDTKKTILFSTHEIDLAIQLSDLIILMTPEGTNVDSPAQLIQNGHFDALFPEDTVVFDAKTGRFTIKN